MKQFEMNFNEANSFKTYLDEGQFFALVEASYGEAMDAEKISQVHKLAQELDSRDIFAGIAFLDHIKEHKQLDPISNYPHFKEYAKKAPLFYFSGRGRSEEEIVERVADLCSAGALNMVSATGNAYSSAKESKTKSYVDSVKTLKFSKARQEALYNGVVFNPFKYSVNDSFAQYFKLVKKIRTGADFFVTQAGWDMKKYQETLLFLKDRELPVPAIARLRMIKTEDMPKLRKLSIHPGVNLSREFCSMIEREFSAGELQFKAVQFKRLAMQIIGCKLMGYNGVQLSGIDSIEELKTLEQQISILEKELYSFDIWCKEWKSFHDSVTMSIPPYSFYMYSNLLNPNSNLEQQDHSPEAADFDNPSAGQLWRYKVAKNLKIETRPALLQKLVCGNSSQDFELKASHYTPLDQCPKKLYSGACGGSQVDGTCEVGEKPCIHNEHISLAAYFNDLDRLEEAEK